MRESSAVFSSKEQMQRDVRRIAIKKEKSERQPSLKNAEHRLEERTVHNHRACPFEDSVIIGDPNLPHKNKDSPETISFTKFHDIQRRKHSKFNQIV